MRVVIQRVKQASVSLAGIAQAEIKQGLLVLVGIHQADELNDAIFLAEKILALRVFPDQNKKMNLNVAEIQGSVLVVSQFTLYANTASGNRPDFSQAAPPEKAHKLYLDFLSRLKKGLVPVSSGVFGAAMQVTLINDGPVTIIMDSR